MSGSERRSRADAPTGVSADVVVGSDLTLMTDPRRKYYDHEAAYRRIAAQGGAGWDDLTPGATQSSYVAIDWFLESRWCPAPSSSPRALDVGCGGGQVALRLVSRGFAVTATDFAETAIELARSNAARAGITVRISD